jgi:hypothetical protein
MFLINFQSFHALFEKIFRLETDCSVEKNKVSFNIETKGNDMNSSLIASKAGKYKCIHCFATHFGGFTFLSLYSSKIHYFLNLI